jgi:hypothetical protein
MNLLDWEIIFKLMLSESKLLHERVNGSAINIVHVQFVAALFGIYTIFYLLCFAAFSSITMTVTGS